MTKYSKKINVTMLEFRSTIAQATVIQNNFINVSDEGFVIPVEGVMKG